MVLVWMASAAASTWIVGVTETGRPGVHAAAQAHDAATHCWVRAPLCVVQGDDALAAALRGQPGVRYVDADGPMPPPLPTDAQGTAACPDQWELETIRAPDAWTLAQGEHAPVVAIQDSGFLTTHQELTDRISGQYDYGNGDPDPEVERASGVPDHGTFIAGMIAADPDNGVGRSGAAPYARLNLQKIADDDGALYWSYAIWALADLADGDLGVRVLNYSIGGPVYNQGFRDAIAALEDVGILVVTAAGNCGSPDCSTADNDATPFYPGSFGFDHVVTVAGSLRDDTLNPYSHYGASSVDLAAPGTELCSCGVNADDNYYTAGGTSYATPLVAAVAALVFERHPDLSTTEAARVLRASAQDQADLVGKVRSGGRLDAYAALTTAVPRLDAPPDVALEGTGTLTVTLANAGHAGEAWLVLDHTDALSVVAVRDRVSDTDWTLTRAGDPVDLPDAGAVDTVSVAHGPLDTHGSATLEITLRGRVTGETELHTRALLTSAGADYLNAPYAAGTQDTTGFLAWTSAVDVRAATDETGLDDTGDTGGADDTGQVGSGCSGCGGGPAAGWLAAPLLLLLTRRRR